MAEVQIAILAEHRAELRRALDAALPRECCGVLLGDKNGDRLLVKRVLRTLNITTTVGEFSIPDDEIRRVRWLSRQYGKPIIAVFHSHPDGSDELSGADRRSLAHSEWPWIVVTPAPESLDSVELRYYSNGPSQAVAQVTCPLDTI
jgi:proteasome lid subunit RPN8/RPN11